MLKLRKRERFYGRPKEGERAGWYTEWQIVDGRRVIYRNEIKEWAVRWAKDNRPSDTLEPA